MRIYFILFVFFPFSVWAYHGDTTRFRAHTNTQLTWYESYDTLAILPDDSKNYQNISMEFTLGCGDNGCSHWDYTTRIWIGEETEQYDSSIVSIDTVSVNPIILDTVWSAPFKVYNWYELGRMITPYGTYMDQSRFGFDNSWSQTWSYDVTDFEPLLHDSVLVRISFEGWPQGGRGFSADLSFVYTEGVPLRKVTAIHPLYSDGSYVSSTQFEQDVLPSQSISVQASHADLKTIITGHGQDGEFTPISYRVNAGTTQVGEKELWRLDCSEIPLHPQGGTWIYNRANWCPGDAVAPHYFNLTPYITNNSITLDMDFDAYSPSEAYYNIAAYLIEYEPIERLYDVAVSEIISPSENSDVHTIASATSTSNFTREVMAICRNPKISIENLGRETLTYCQIEYGIVQGTPFYFEWSGSLAYGDKETVVLPIINWNELDVNAPSFYAEVSYPNHLVDQFMYNNKKIAHFDLPLVVNNGNLRFRFRTNNQAQENTFLVSDVYGDTVIFKDDFQNSTTYNMDTFLTPGCYVIDITDTDQYFMNGDGGDGLSWWVNTNNNLESAGYFDFRDQSNRILYFNPDFGHKFHYEFMIGEPLNAQTSIPSPGPVPSQAAIQEIEYNGQTIYFMADSGLYFSETNIGTTLEEVSIKSTHDLDIQFSVSPNPINHNATFIYTDEKNRNGVIDFIDIQGRVLVSRPVQPNQPMIYNFSHFSKGIYFSQLTIENNTITKKIIVK